MKNIIFFSLIGLTFASCSPQKAETWEAPKPAHKEKPAPLKKSEKSEPDKTAPTKKEMPPTAAPEPKKIDFHLGRQFSIMDTNADNKLSRQEYFSGSGSNDIEALQKKFDGADFDKNGVLSFDEFQNIGQNL